MLISNFGHFHSPYVFSTLFLNQQEWNVALPRRAVAAERNFQWNGYWMKTWKPAASPRTNEIHQLSHRADNRGQHRGRHSIFLHSADKRGQDLSLSESTNVNPADIRGQDATPPKIPRTSADIPRTTANACFHSPRTMRHPQTCEFHQICSPPKPNILHDGGPRQIL